MSSMSITVHCASCDALIYKQTGESISFIAKDHVPCRECGSSALRSAFIANETVGRYEQMRAKLKRPEIKKPVLEMKHGKEIHRATNTLRHVSRTIDRGNDCYTEVIHDHEGHVVREVNEPLSAHIERGSAKKVSK